MPGWKKWFGFGLDQDWVDTANGFWSVVLLAVLSVGALLARYFTESISCWSPAQFEDSQVAYATQTCFYRNKYYSTVSDSNGRDQTSGVDFSYHLWIPMFLFFQALCFKIPNVIWNFGKPFVALNLDDTVDSLKKTRVSSPEIRKSVLRDTAAVLQKQLEKQKFSKTVLYMSVKLLYCLNLSGQLILLAIYFGNSLFINVGSDIDSPIMVKFVHCNFQIRQLTRVYDYTVQCVLAVTDLYEKIFVFLFYWVLILAVLTVFNLFLWAGYLFVPFLRDSRVSTYIRASPKFSQDSSVITRFTSDFLGIDGVLVLSMISRNSSEMVAADLSQQLYELFLERHRPGISSPLEGTAEASLRPTAVGAVTGELEKSP